MNYLAVLVAAIASFVIGWIWYAKPVFGNLYHKLGGSMGSKKGMGSKIVSQLIVSLVTAYVLAMFTGLLSATTFSAGIVVGFWAWLGFAGATTMGNVIWGKQSFKLWLLSNGLELVSYAVMAGIVASWM